MEQGNYTALGQIQYVLLLNQNINIIYKNKGLQVNLRPFVYLFNKNLGPVKRLGKPKAANQRSSIVIVSKFYIDLF